MEIPRTALVQLLEEDGIVMPKNGGGPEKTIRCFSPHHDDAHPSMSVNTTDGVYKCHGCGISGGVWHYLTDIRGMEPADAMETLKVEHGWSPDRVEHDRGATETKRGEREKLAKGRPRWSKGLVQPEHIVAEHDYIDSDGVLVTKVVRYRSPVRHKVMPHTPASGEREGWWLAKPTHSGLPEDDAVEKVPLYALPYLSKRIKEHSEQQIWVVEGEKCADAVNNLPYGGEGEPPIIPPATTLIGGGSRKSYTDVDLEPLYGRRVMLIADTDESGRAHMLRLADHLYTHGTKIRMCLPAGEGGYDIADAIAEGGYAEALAWAKSHDPSDYRPKTSNPASELPSDAPVDSLADNPHYRLLGVTSDGCIVAQRKETHSIFRLRANTLAQSHNLVPLAPLQYWTSLTANGALGRQECLALQDGIIREAERKGLVRTDSALGRGAAVVKGQYVYNLGDMLLTPDPDTHKLTVRTEFGGSDALFLPRPVIHLTERTDRAREYAQDLHSVIMRYRWAGRMHGRALAGWLVSSLIGGALDHRPALWLLADRDTGKTYLLERIIGAMMDDCITSLADTSEAGLAAMVGADSMPVYIDEFESEDSREHTWSALLKLLRISTGGKGVRARGTPGGEYTLSHPRFSLLVASTRQPDLKPTDHSRILTISLAKRGVADWPVLREDIKRATSYDRMLAVRTAIIEQSGVLADKVRSLEMRMIARGENTSSREAQITAALTVGDGWLAGLERPEEATPVRRDLDDSMTDEHDLLSALLSAEVRTEKGATTTISNTLRRGWWASKGTGEMVFSPYAGLEYYQELAKHHGLMMTQDGGLAVACNYPPLSALLAHTQHAHTSIEKYLANLPGVTRYATESGKRARIRFGAGGLLRGALIVPNELLADVGLV